MTKDVLTKSLDALNSRSQRQQSLVCLEKSLHLGIAKPKSTLTTTIQFVAVEEGLLPMERITVSDAISNKAFSMRDNHYIYVQDIAKIAIK